jgi:hypothetical protein
LFRCHVGKRTGDGLGRLGCLALAGQARCDAKPGEPHVSIRAVHHNISWLDVFVDEPALMKLAQSRGNSDSEAQEASYLHGPTEQTVERLAARIVEHQHGPTGVAHEGQRPRRPCPVELIFQLVFVREAIES